MKRIKKLASLMLAIAMVMAMTVTAFAADNKEYTIKINGNSADKGTHTYQAYQIFAGDLKVEKNSDGTENKILSNIIWGSGITNETGLLDALKGSDKFVVDGKNVFDDCTTASGVAEEVSKFASSDANSSKMIDDFATVVSGFLSQDYAINGNDVNATPNEIHVNGAGYYLVRDMNASLVDQDEAAYTRFLLQVVGNSEVTVKSEVPSGDKQTYVVTPEGNQFNAADANYGNIGSHVSYVITSHVPNYEGYDYYYFIMNDTLDKGLDFDGANTVTVTVTPVATTDVPNPVPVELVQGTDYRVYTEDVAPYSFRLAFTNIMTQPINATITVTYSATVTDEVEKIGVEGNANTWNLQYSNNPNATYDGTQQPDEPGSKPGLPIDEDETILGKTPDEKTLTYLTQLDITKFANGTDLSDVKNYLLEGAEFTLTGTSYQVVAKGTEYYREAKAGETPTWYLLTDGTYTETAPTGTKYVAIGVGTAETTTGYIEDGNNGYVIPDDTKEYNGKTLYKLVKGTSEDYVDVNKLYVKDTATSTELVPVKVSIELTTDANGNISFVGLGAGDYTLTETVTPAGFNTLDPIEFSIGFEMNDKVATGDETCTWTFTSKTDGFDVLEGWGAAAGRFAANVVNQSGSLLPSTGGIGTTIFYVVGGILVVAAGILLVTKKRMSAR